MDKRKFLNNIQHNLSYFGSNFDITDALHCGEDKILKYSELKHYNSLQDLLPELFDYKVILLETSKNSGHWTCIIRMGDVIELFNSYGISIDSEFRFIPDVIERLLGESKRYLTNLVKKNKIFKIVSNNCEFQSQNESVATCSRWCIFRIDMARIGYSLESFINMIEKKCNKDDLPPDILVLYFIKFRNDKPL